MTSLNEIIKSRRTIYKFSEKEVPREIIVKALEAASTAPCHKHTHPWKFYSIGKKSREKLIPEIVRLAVIKANKKGTKDVEKASDRAVEKIISAPVLFAVTSKLTPNDPFREKEDYAATVCALHNMVLSFWSNEVGSLWSTGSITREEETYRILGIEKEKEEIIGFIRAGYPHSTPTVKKPPYQEVTIELE